MADSRVAFRTPAGTHVLVEPLPHVRSISLGFWVRRGSAHEAAHEEGLAHFIEHTVFKGTESYPTPEVMAAATDRLGGNLDAFTGKETACFYGKVLQDQLPELVKILGELVTRPLFDPQELVRERSVVLEEIAQSEDTPEDWVNECFYDGFWAGDPLAHSILGRPEQVEAIEAEGVRAFFEHTYRAPHLLVSAAGNVEPQALMDLLAPILDRLPGGTSGTEPPPSAPKPFFLNLPRKDLQQTSFVMGFPVGGHSHGDRVAYNLLSVILGGGMSSRLFMELREKQALCYQVGAYVSPYRGTGALQISASCATARAREFAQRTLAECVRLAQEGATPDELERAKRQARTSLVFGQESTGSRMFSQAHQAIHLDRVYTMDDMLAEIEALTLDDLNRVAREVLRPECFAVAALGVKKGQAIRREDLG